MPKLLYHYQPLLFDFGHEADKFMELYQRVDDMVRNGDFLHKMTWQANPMDKTNVGLPIVNWPAPPPLRLNQLYWPCTGATRWAEGLFLCTGKTKRALDTCSLASSGANLVWYTDDPPTVNSLLGTEKRYVIIKMWPLAFRRVAGCHKQANDPFDPNNVLPTSNDDDYDLYVVHLVDQRYWWQFVDAPDVCENTTTWAALTTYLSGQLGVTVTWYGTDALPSAFTTCGPHASEWSRASYNAALLFDAALESVGVRLVAGIEIVANGTTNKLEYQRYTGAEETFLINTGGGNLTEQLAGTDCNDAYQRAVPAYVNVEFPKSRFGMLCGQCSEGSSSTEDDCYESYYTIDHQFSEYLSAIIHCSVSLTQKTVHVRGWADMGTCDDTTPMNNTELVAIAEQIAQDWYLYHKRQYDFTTVAPTAWDPCGYDDSIIFKFGIEYEDDFSAVAVLPENLEESKTNVAQVVFKQNYRRDVTCRIQSLPLNVGVDCHLHNTNALELPDNLIVKTPSGGIAKTDDTTLTGELCVAYRVVGQLACGELEREKITAIDAAHLGEDYEVMVYNTICDQDIEGDTFIVTDPLKCCARKVTRICYDYTLTGGALAENHPGRGVPFDIHLATWDPATDSWAYDCQNTVKAIDWRYGVPYPDEDATGLFQKRTSTTYDYIYEVVALDCESPNDACNGSSS